MTTKSNSSTGGRETGEPERCWIEWRTRHAYTVKPEPYVETVEYARVYDANGWPTDAGAEAMLRESGSSGKEVINGFIDQLLRERAELERERDALREAIVSALRELGDDHVTANLNRLGLLGKDCIQTAQRSLRAALGETK